MWEGALGNSLIRKFITCMLSFNTTDFPLKHTYVADSHCLAAFWREKPNWKKTLPACHRIPSPTLTGSTLPFISSPLAGYQRRRRAAGPPWPARPLGEWPPCLLRTMRKWGGRSSLSGASGQSGLSLVQGAPTCRSNRVWEHKGREGEVKIGFFKASCMKIST